MPILAGGSRRKIQFRFVCGYPGELHQNEEIFNLSQNTEIVAAQNADESESREDLPNHASETFALASEHPNVGESCDKFIKSSASSKKTKMTNSKQSKVEKNVEDPIDILEREVPRDKRSLRDMIQSMREEIEDLRLCLSSKDEIILIYEGYIDKLKKECALQRTGREVPAMHFTRADSQDDLDAVAKERSSGAGDDATEPCRKEQAMWNPKRESEGFDAKKGELTEQIRKSSWNQESNTWPENMKNSLEGKETAGYPSCSQLSIASDKPKGKSKSKTKDKKSSQGEQPDRNSFSLKNIGKRNKNSGESKRGRRQFDENVIEDLHDDLEAKDEIISKSNEAINWLTYERQILVDVIKHQCSDSTEVLEALKKLNDYRCSPQDWIIERDEVHADERSLESEAWGIRRSQCGLEGPIQAKENALGPRLAWSTSLEGKFRGCPVAVKKIHGLILTPRNRRMFEREMSIASRCRHPNLVQFIGATNDYGSPLFITELLDTDLRSILEQRALCYEEVVCLALDIARGLNYLHLNKYLPILHRDISSSNVFLWKREKTWRAKLSDYGAANFMRENLNPNPGAWIYSAPDNQTTQPTPKEDVYSFGVLLCEMCTRELPDPPRLKEQIKGVSDGQLRDLIEKCVHEDPQARPTMSYIIDILEGFKGAS